MKGYFYKPHCKCKDSKGNSKNRKKCSCGAKWAYMIDVGIHPTTGKRKQKKKGGFATKTEAQEAATLMYAELTSGTYVEEKKITFQEFAYEWLDIYKASGKEKKPGTIYVRENEIQRLLEFFGKLQLKDISRLQYQKTLNTLKEKGYTDSTMDGIHRTAKMIFKKAMELEVIKKDPTEFAQLPKTQKTVEELETEQEIPKYMEKDELSRLLQIAKEQSLYKDYPIYMLLAYTGMRTGELCALKWKDIDFKEGTISITKTIYNPTNSGRNYTLLPPKTSGSKRTIDVDHVVLNMLERHKAYQNKVKMKLRKDYYDGDFIFGKTSKPNAGYPDTVLNIYQRMKRFVQRIEGFNHDLTPHSFRHTHTSLLAEAGVSLPDIMERLGHTNDMTTTQIYLHITKTRKKETSHKFSRFMEGL